MAHVNANVLDNPIPEARPDPRGSTVTVLPLNLIALIVSYLEDVGDLARVCRTCRVLYYMTLPQLYGNLTLTSYDKIRYRDDDQPEGCGSASPFSMGLSAVLTRNIGSLVRSMTLRGEWREDELEEHAKVGRVPDSSMMLNIVVRAALDRLPELESFSWELNTKMLETVYQGLSQLPKLTSLTVRFPSSRHPRPTTVIPPMPHLRSLMVTDIDPLCYPDDMSTLLFGSKKLQELKLRWSPRMREAQEPSVSLHSYFRKSIAAKQPLRVKKLALENLYALHTDEFNDAILSSEIEEIHSITSAQVEDDTLSSSFIDNSWPRAPAGTMEKLKCVRLDRPNRKFTEFLGSIHGIERLYFVNTGRFPSEDINTPRPSMENSSMSATPPSNDSTHTSSLGPLINPSNKVPGTGVTASPQLSSNNANNNLLLRDVHIPIILNNHGSTLRHLALPSKWPLSDRAMARLVRASPNLEQLALATEVSSIETLGLLIPFLRKLTALRLLIPTYSVGTGANSQGHTPVSSSPQATSVTPYPGFAKSVAELVELDDSIHNETIGATLADKEIFGTLRVIGFGWKAWELGDYYTIPKSQATLFQTYKVVDEVVPAENNVAVPPPSSSTPPAPTSGPRHFTDARRSETVPPSTLGKRPRGSSIPHDNGFSAWPEQNEVHEPNKRATPNGTHQNTWVTNSGNGTIDIWTQNDTGWSSRPCTQEEAKQNAQEEFLWRRRARRVGWEVLKNWEIWALDRQQI